MPRTATLPSPQVCLIIRSYVSGSGDLAEDQSSSRATSSNQHALPFQAIRENASILKDLFVTHALRGFLAVFCRVFKIRGSACSPNLRRGPFTAEEVMLVACLHLKLCRSCESPISEIGIALGTTDAYGLPLDFRSPFDISDLLRKTAEKVRGVPFL